MSRRSPWSVVWALAVTQVVSWGSIYYAIAVLIAPIEQELGWRRDAIVGAFSLSLIFAGLGAVPAGIVIDRYGGRVVMTCGSLAAAALFFLLSNVQSLPAFYLIWAGLGIAMAAVLYEPAFTVITATFGANARKAITALTLVGGFASTVFWPLTQGLVSAFGWRHALVALALCNFVICVPLHALYLPASAPRRAGPEGARGGVRPREDTGALGVVIRTPAFWLLATAFTINMLAHSSLSVHLIPLLHEKGYSAADAVWLAALVGPMQVAGRVAEFTIGSRFRAAHVAVFALALLPVAVVSLGYAGAAWVPVLVFVTLYGASNGIMTIARGTIPAEIFGREHFGAVNGALSAPVLAARALGPLLASIIWSAAAGYDPVLWTLAALGLVSLASFCVALSRDRR